MLVSAVYYGSFYNYGISLYDEGHLVNLSERVLEGQTYYRDWWTIYAPGRFFLFAALFKTFGVSLLVTRVFWLVLRVVTVGIYYLVARRVIGVKYSLIASMVILLVPGNWHATFITFLPLLFLLSIFEHLRTGSMRWIAYSGVVTGVALFVRQDTGVYIFIAGMALLPVIVYSGAGGFNSRFAKVILQSLPLYIVFSLSGLLLYWLVSGPYLGDVLYGLFVKPMAFAQSVSIPFNKVSLAGGTVGIFSLRNLEGMFFYVPPVACAGTLLVLVRMYSRAGLDRYWIGVLAVMLVGIANLNHYLWQSNTGHLLKSSAISYILVAFLLERYNMRSRCRSVAGYTVNAAAVAVVLAFVALFVLSPAFNTGAIGRRMANTRLLKYDRARVYLPEGLCLQVEGVVDYLAAKNTGDTKVLVLTHDSMLRFLAGMGNPTRYEYFEPGMLDMYDQKNTYRDALDADYIVYYEPNTLLGYPRQEKNRFSVFCGYLYENLLPNFEYDTTVGEYQVLRRSGGRHADTLHFIGGYDSYLYGNYVEAAREFMAVPPGSASYNQAQYYLGIIKGRQ